LRKALVEGGVDATLLTFDGLSTGEDDCLRLVECYGRIGKLWRFVTKVPFFGYPLETALSFWFGMKWGRDRGYDIVHLLDTSTTTFIFIFLASLAKGYNLVLTLHTVARKHHLDILDSWMKEVVRTAKQKDFKRLVWLIQTKLAVSKLGVMLEKRLYKRATRRNRILFISNARESMSTYGGSDYHKDIVYVPDARPSSEPISKQVARERLGLPQSVPILLAFGVDHLYKDYEVICKALVGLDSDIRLFVAGKFVKDTADKPMSIIERHKLLDRCVVLEKYFTNKEMLDCFYASDVLLATYKRGFPQISGNILQAEQCNLPVIGISTGHIGDYIRKRKLGFTYEPEDAVSLRNAIKEFLSLSDSEIKELKHNIANSGKASIWKQMTEGYIGVYKKLGGVN
jgi:glycosyltransferase involved in cell wall biosynthesis